MARHKSTLVSLSLCFLLPTSCHSIRFRGYCPEAPPSVASFSFPKINDTISLAVLAPLTKSSALDAPLFAKRIIGTGKCSFEFSMQFDGVFQNFYIAYQNVCYSMDGKISSEMSNDDSYELNYGIQFERKTETTRNNETLECTRDHVYTNRVFIYNEFGILIFWICMNNRPEIGSHDQGIVAFVSSNMEADDYLTIMLNQLYFTKLTFRHFLDRKKMKCESSAFPCPVVDCPTVRETWKTNLGVIIWLACFAGVSFISTGFCRILACRRKRQRKTGIFQSTRIIVRQEPIVAWTD